jgi:putative FmdB family regulatory protein
MPMYEYHCEECGTSFELRRGMNEADSDVVCMLCGSSKVARQFSICAPVSKEGAASTATLPALGNGGGGGGCCGGGGCGCGL